MGFWKCFFQEISNTLEKILALQPQVSIHIYPFARKNTDHKHDHEVSKIFFESATFGIKQFFANKKPANKKPFSRQFQQFLLFFLILPIIYSTLF